MKTCKLPECSNEFKVTSSNSSKVYCSRSCSTVNSNRVSPRRKKTKICKQDGCVTLVTTRTAYCSDECKPLRVDVSEQTLGELRSAAKYQFNARVRDVAREAYHGSGQPYRCLECGYTLHINVCHIKDIHMYDETTLVSETCKLDNLVALCKNHHWEFDHGYLEVLGVLKPLNPSKIW